MAEVLQFPAPVLPYDPVVEAGPASTRDTLTLTDAQAREAALDIQRSWIIEAPAGSGKTGLLIQRYLKLLAHGEVVSPREVLALTFTRKAVAELRNRVLEQLAAAAENKPLPSDSEDFARLTRQLATEVLARDRALGWHLLSSPQSLNIRTIDALCGELAGSLPLLSGGVGRHRPVDDASLLYEEAAGRTLRELGSDKDPRLHDALRTVLFHRDAQIGDAVRLMAGMLAEREQWGELVPLHGGELSEEMLDGTIRRHLERTLEKAICAGLSRAARTLSPGLLEELTHFASRLSKAPGYNNGISPLAVCSGQTQAPGDSAHHLSHWLALIGLVLTKEGTWRKGVAKNTLGFEISKSEKSSLEDLIAQLRAEDDRSPGLREALGKVRCLPPARYPEDQWRVVKALFRVLRHALTELSVLFAERGLCDFTEIALTARSLLRSAPDLLQLPGARIAHLLVDEMQDTSVGQYELLELLTRNWDGTTQTLFLVGDPKQSIYLFRQARVARFLRTQATGRLGDMRLRALRLTANFRSQAQLVTDFNDMFSLVLARPGSASQGMGDEAEVPFVAAEPTRSRGTTPALHWHAQLSPGRGSSEADMGVEADATSPASDANAADQAQSIRQHLEDFERRWSARPTPPGAGSRPPKMAVLARSRAHFAPILAEFKRNRGSGPLPFRAVDVELLHERREILDLLALTRALLHPGDRVAWLAVLRSPVCGITLADLLALCGEGSNAESEATLAHLVATRAHLLSAEGQELLGRAWAVLSAAQALRGHTAFSTQVERTWRSLGADAPLDPAERINARQFFQLLRELEARPESLSLFSLQRALRKLYAAPQPAPHAVELMTIHKAKGLEWDLVLVPALETNTAGNQHKLLKWLELDGEHDGEAELILSPIAGRGEDASKLSDWLSGLETAREAAEAKRLLYVACTRAREELHLFATCIRTASGSLALPPAKSLLRAGWAAAEPALTSLLSTAKTTPQAVSLELPAAPYLFDIPSESLALAASEDPDLLGSQSVQQGSQSHTEARSTISRLPANFDPLARFRAAAGVPLPYVSANDLRHAASFQRPEGSFRARAFGNAMHRFLDLLAQRLAAGDSFESLQNELPGWHRRLQTTFRGEGIAPSLSVREADRALQALAATLQDAEGRWVLFPHAGACSEQSLQINEAHVGEFGGHTLRADRTFLSGADSLSKGTETHLWIVDYKTTEPGGRALSGFLAAEKEKYQPQLQAYAEALTPDEESRRPIVLALYYPLLPQLLYWPYEPKIASE